LKRGDEIEVEEPGGCCRRSIINLDRNVEGVNYPEGVLGGKGGHGTVNCVQRRK
jgi:hypothetical protein